MRRELEGVVRSKEGFVLFLFKVRNTTGYLYADGINPIDKEKLMRRRKRENF